MWARRRRRLDGGGPGAQYRPMFGLGPKTALPTPETALRGRETPMPVP